MKYLIFISLLILNTFLHAESLSNLDSLEWEKRVVIVNEMKSQDKILKLLKKAVIEINDRDIIWFLIKDNFALSNYKGHS